MVREIMPLHGRTTYLELVKKGPSFILVLFLYIHTMVKVMNTIFQCVNVFTFLCGV